MRRVRVRWMRDKVMGVRMEDDRWRWRWRVVHTNVAFLLTREMPVRHGRGREDEVEGEGQKGSTEM